MRLVKAKYREIDRGRCRLWKITPRRALLRRRRLQAGASFQHDETNLPGMKPFSGFHEGMVKPPAITGGPLETRAKGKEGDDRHGARDE
jgi:hypothetical protein